MTFALSYARPSGHIGNYLASAARQVGIDCEIIDASSADVSSRWCSRRKTLSLMRMRAVVSQFIHAKNWDPATTPMPIG
jgi:hypothetical protein